MSKQIPNTFGLEASARSFLEFATEAELHEILTHRDTAEPLFVVGGGSNLLFTKDFAGTVLHSRILGIEILDCGTEALVRVGSGEVWDDFCRRMVESGLSGAENMSYIPGEVGASAVQNVGAYGSEAKDIIHTVETIEIATGRARKFTNSECRFGYRDSVFKQELRGQYVVTHVTFRLMKGSHPDLKYRQLKEHFAGRRPTIAEVREAVIDIRRQKLPEPAELGSAGSFFKNPVVDEAVYQRLQADYPTLTGYPTEHGVKLSAAWLIDHAGLKGYRHQQAAVYDRQPLVIVNLGGATAEQIIHVADHVIETVNQRFGIRLSPEVNYI